MSGGWLSPQEATRCEVSQLRLQCTALPAARLDSRVLRGRWPHQAPRSRRSSARPRSGWRRSRPSPRRLVLEAVGDGEHPGRGHLDRHQARVRRVHQREPDVVLAQQLRVAAAWRGREQQVAAGRATALRRPRACRCRAAPSRPKGPSRARAQRQHAELEHVAGRVRLGARVEQQPARCAPASSPRSARTGGDRVLERRRVAVPLVGAAGVDADAVAAEVVAQQLGREQRECGNP